MSPPPQNSDARLFRVRAWTLIPASFGPALAWAFIEQGGGVSEYASHQVNGAILYATALVWWMVVTAPRPYSVRAAMGRPFNPTDCRLVMVAMLGVSCLRIIEALTVYCRDLPRVASSGGAYNFELTGPDPANLAALLLSVVVAPLVEELVFRGVLFRAWRVRWNPALALLMSSILFGAFHREGVAAFLTGLTYALLYTRTRSLWANVLAHSLNNAAMVAIGALHYFWASPRLRLDGPVTYGAFALILLIGTGVWVHFVLESWQTLDAPLSPDSAPATAAVSPPADPPDALRAGSQLR